MMNPLEIFRALQAGEKNAQEAKKALLDAKKAARSSLQKQQKEMPAARDRYGVVLTTVHSLQELALRQWTVPEPAHDEVTIQVKASAINFPDIMCVKGLYPTMPDYPFVPGFEVSGIVSAVGSRVSGISAGDEVIALTGKQMGGHASYVNVPVNHIIPKPGNISFEEACGLPVVFATVYYAFELAKLAHQEHVLIQTATGGCGLMAIQLAHLKECVIYGTSSKPEKLEILRKLHVPYVINYKTSEFDREIKRITNNRGVDVVLNMLSGDGIQKGLNCLAPSGRYLEIAVHALKTSPKLDLSKLVRNQAIYSIDLRRLGFHKGDPGSNLLNIMVSMLQAGEIVPIVSRIYPVRQIQDALAYVAQGQHIGKVVISHTKQTMTDETNQCLERLLEQGQNCKTSPPSIHIKTPSPLGTLTGKQEKPIEEGIAIIGMSGQFPRSKDLTAFWDNLAHGTDCISEIPATRWSNRLYYDPDPKVPGKTYCKWMGALEDADRFDPLFFNISPAEAKLMDPQQRLFLQNCWHCLEDAGLNPSRLAGSRCGVFVGCAVGDYLQTMSSQGLDGYSLLAGSISILSARISYFLNLKGPCLSIDTACSASLVATAEACNSLVLHTSDLALAGGVFVMAGPTMHIRTSKIGMLSKEGRCFSFDNRANGFVPGEGVGVILLKRLPEAVRDQDPIYGVIRGWGINQDGKTNGITAPSMNSQILLEKDVYQRFNISPAEISLLEAHGTGTKLGDPIEVGALKESFRSFTPKKNYCALGSVKSNIGHTMTAAGVAGVIKVLLAMRHRMLPPTIHFETLNEHISLDDSPFYINTRLQPWKVAPGTPRRGAVSSFGFSGTNAHIVIEEYLPSTDTRGTTTLIDTANPALFVLSASSNRQLKTYAENMKNYIQLHEDLNLVDIAYTLQVGRMAMDYRLAFLAASRADLLNRLEGFINNNSTPGIITGQVKRDKDSAALIEKDEQAKALLQNCIQKKKHKKVAELWVKGLDPDWNQLYGDGKTRQPRKVHLPAYPFARESYWIPWHPTGTGSTVSASNLHPLLQQNTSDFSQQRFSSTFTGQEFFLADHVVKGQRILPGVAHLEMAREGAAQAAKNRQQGSTGIRLKNVVWIRPIVIEDQPLQVHIGLFPKDNGQIAYEIYSKPEAADAKPVVYSQGHAVPDPLPEVPPLDLKNLQAECSLNSLSSAQCYDAFQAMGIHYGPGHQGIEKVYVGPDRVLAKLSLPSPAADTLDQFVLHPGLMDSALQASIGLTPGKLALPFALQELDIYGNCTANMWALLRYSENSKAGDQVEKLDVDLCDDQGTIRVRMKGFSMRAPGGKVETIGTLMLHPVWKEQTISRDAAAPAYDQHVVMLCEPGEKWKGGSEEVGIKMIDLLSQQEEIEQRFQSYTLRLFREIRDILKNKPGGKVLIQVVTSTEKEQGLFSGLSGLLKTARLENPKLIGQLIEVTPAEDRKSIIEKLKENSCCPNDTRIRYQEGKRWVENIGPISPIGPMALPWKDRGIYLITGGAGGLGLIFAREITGQVKEATVILAGRSPLSEDKQAQIRELEASSSGARTQYQQVDVTQKKAVDSLIRGIRENYGSLHGIIHCAGVIRDNFILKKTPGEFQEVLAPKVTGLVNLDQASKDLPLDFFILFSSAAAVLGNIGQADYAAANAFMDAYARYRNRLVSSKQRQGQTLSINWPLWKEGGMHIDEETEKTRMQRTGMIALQTPTGIRALYRALASGKHQVMVMEGDLTKLRASLPGPGQQTAVESTQLPTAPEIDTGNITNLKDKMISYLIGMICDTLKVKPEQIDIYKSLDKYGLDSIMVVDINNRLEQHFSDLSKTLFFEYGTINDLADYFIESQKETLVKLFKLEGVLNPIRNPGNTGPRPNEPSDHISYQPSSKPNRSAYLAKQRNSRDIGLVESQAQAKDNITALLVEQIENGNLFLDDIITQLPVDIITANNSRHQKNGLSGPLVIHEKELENNPAAAKLIKDIDTQTPPLGYVRLSYPYFFILPEKSKYIRLIIDQANRLIIPYMYMEESIYQELFHYSQKMNHQLLIVEPYHQWLDSRQTRLIPLGVFQHLDINSFTLKGNKMRKLRYLIEKFKKSGEVKTEEYHSLSSLPFNEMKELMIKWGESKKNIIHYSLKSMEELLQQKLPAGYRAFLTYFNKKLCSVIVIEKGEDGYLMDQEFYDPKSAPLGHMEYTIVEIIEQLKKEGLKTFSLGLTWHPFIFEEHPQKDPEAWAWLKEQNDKQTLLSRIFQQGKTNYQFKKKFGVIGEPIFAYLPRNAPFSLLLNYWAVFYQNSFTAAQLMEQLNKISVPGSNNPGEEKTGNRKKHHPDKNERQELLDKTDRLEQVHYHDSPLDLLTDSWFSVQSPAVKKRTTYLKTQSHQKTMEAVQEIFPFKHIMLTTQGRIAEMFFYQAFPGKKKKILTTIPWTTTLMHQLNNGFDVIEIPHPSALLLGSTHLFKGEMDVDALKKQLQKKSSHIAMVGLEVLSNASGGHPVRLSHIHLLKTILRQYRVPLVLDASRIVRNALLIKQYEDAYKQHAVWDIVRETAKQAEYIVTSLSKDFAVPVGGLIATNDDQLAEDIQKNQLLYGQTTPDIETMILQALSEPESILDFITRQMTFTRRLNDMLIRAGAPILALAYGHAVVIDVSQLAEGETNQQKKETFLKKLFLETGIRGGIHQVGKQKNTPLDQCIRLAFPLGLAKQDEESIYDKLQNFFIKNNGPVPGKQPVKQPNKPGREVTVHV